MKDQEPSPTKARVCQMGDTCFDIGRVALQNSIKVKDPTKGDTQTQVVLSTGIYLIGISSALQMVSFQHLWWCVVYFSITNKSASVWIPLLLSPQSIPRVIESTGNVCALSSILVSPRTHQDKGQGMREFLR